MKETYIQAHIARLTQKWIGISALLGSVLFLLLGAMDFYVTPQNLKKFAFYRITISLFLLVVYALNKYKRKTTYQYTIILIGVTFSAATVELMILSLGGHTSSYYGGLNLIIIAVLGFIPLNLPVALAGVFIVYAVYLVPLAFFDTITNWPFFISSNAFMMATFIIGLTWRMLSQKSMLNELSLQYDLAQERSKLEQLVQERTRELHESDQWHRSLFENATDGIMILDRNGLIVNLNEKACGLHGFPREALIGTHSSLLEAGDYKEQSADRIRRILGNECLVFETEHYRRDGGRIALEISSKAISRGSEVYIQSFQRDITEKKKIQEHLFQSQKMESIGALAGGIAHDFNNILTAILGHTELIREEGEAGERVLGRISVIERAARTAGRMASQLLGFARKSAFEILPVNLSEIVKDTAQLLERVLDKHIVMRLELADVPLIDGDVIQMEQVIMNLVVNARDAMPGGGQITIQTSSVTAGDGTAGVPPYVPKGRYVVLRVSDTGIGIPEEVRNRIFEPFFTTKERGKGTGLGLALVYGVIAEHRGYITLESKLNAGSVFTIYLPASSRTAAAAKVLPMGSVRGSETILVVDDDEAVLLFMKDSLSRNGYQVISSTNPMDAIDMFKNKAEEISLVVTDVVMPLLNGNELIRELKLVKPAVKVVTISGYSRYVADTEEASGVEFVPKPFESSSLLTTIRRVLDTESSAV